MGLCLDGVGKMSVEVRRESFIIHPSYGYKDIEGTVADENADDFNRRWREEPHPEFMLADLDDLIAALREARKHVKR